MAATAKITIRVEVSGLGSQDIDLSHHFTNSVNPEEILHQYAVIGATETDLNLGDIAVTDLLGVLLIAKGTADIDYVGIMIDKTDIDSVPSTAADNITLNAGESIYLSFNGSDQGLKSTGNIRVKGAAATTAIEYFCFAKNT